MAETHSMGGMKSAVKGLASPAPKPAEVPTPTFNPPSASQSPIDIREEQIDKILSEDFNKS